MNMNIKITKIKKFSFKINRNQQKNKFKLVSKMNKEVNKMRIYIKNLKNKQLKWLILLIINSNTLAVTNKRSSTSKKIKMILKMIIFKFLMTQSILVCKIQLMKFQVLITVKIKSFKLVNNKAL